MTTDVETVIGTANGDQNEMAAIVPFVETERSVIVSVTGDEMTPTATIALIRMETGIATIGELGTESVLAAERTVGIMSVTAPMTVL